jgi:serine/threonine-protein kinase
MLIYIELNPSTNYDIMAIPLDGDRKPVALLATPFDERRPSLSPDGRWMVYQSNESGNFELFVRPFPNLNGGRWQVSTGGGSSPTWPTANEIIFRQNMTIQRVDVQTAPAFSVGSPQPMLQITLPVDAAGMSYAVAPDGKQVVVLKPAGLTGGPTEFRVLFNLNDELRRRHSAK